MRRNKQIAESEYIWPLSANTTPDEMNTSFGPRINNDNWQFHRGMDLPAPCGTHVFAMHSGEIYRTGERNLPTWSSRHVVIKVGSNTKNNRALFLIYLHLNKISDRIKRGVKVEKGDYLGEVGDDGATYCHLHIEFRKANAKGLLDNKRIKHPLNYLRYRDTMNFNGKLKCIYQKSGPSTIKGRLSFTAVNKNEGDLSKTEVSLFKKDSLIGESKIVDFAKSRTIDKSGDSDDRLIFNRQGIGVEGYQKSNMVKSGTSDLYYGILIRNIPDYCDNLSAKVFDVGGNLNVWSNIAISQPSSFEQSLDFEDGLMPPEHWKVVRNINRLADVSNDSTAAYSGQRGMICKISKSSSTALHAAIEYKLPSNQYFEFTLQAMINPYELQLADDNSIYPFYLLNEQNSLSVAAGIYQVDKNHLQAKLIAKDNNGIINSTVDGNINSIKIQKWQKLSLELRRIHTRQTTAKLYLGSKNHLADSQVAIISYDSRAHAPKKLRVGIGFCPANESGTIFIDNVKLSSKV